MIDGGSLEFFAELFGFFSELSEELFGVLPVEADVCGALAQPGGFKKCGQVLGNAIEMLLRGLICGRFLTLLDGLPISIHVGSGGSMDVCEDVGVAADELSVKRGSYIFDREVASFLSHLRIEQDLQQEITEFIAQVRPGAAIDCVEDLVGLFEGVALDRVKGLLTIPGAAAGSAEAGHDGDRFSEGLGAGGALIRHALDRNGEYAVGMRVRAKTGSGWWKLLLLLPYAGLCFPQIYSRSRPELFGFPFFYWYQLAWVVVASAVIWIVYRKLSY